MSGKGAEDSRYEKMPLTRELVFLTVTCASNIITQAGLGMAILPLNIIGNSLEVHTPGQRSWFVSAYSLTVGTFILIAGRAGDLKGHKAILVLGYLWTALWSLVAGLTMYSRSQIFFDICRALQGIGPAMLVPNALALLGSTYAPSRRKDLIFALYGATAPNGFLLGGAFASLLSQLAWWPWAYYVMTIACTVFAAVSFLAVPCQPEPEQQGFDWAGAVVGVLGLVLFNVAWNQAPDAGWGSPYILVFLVLGVLLSGLFVVIELRAAHPLIPPSAFSGTAGFVLACVALGWASFGIWVFYLYQIQLNLRHLTPLLAIAQNAPSGISGILASVTTGLILSRVPTSLVMAIAMLAFCAGNILLGTMPVIQSYWISTFLATIITPWGMDMSFPAATIILSNLMPRHQQGVAASLVATIVNYSISIGLGIAGTVESHVNENGSNLLRGYRGAYYTAIGLSGFGFFVALFAFVQSRRTTKLSPDKDVQ